MNVLLGYANSLSREFAQRHLGQSEPDLHIATAASLADCLELVADFQSLDLIGLDLEMADMDGVSGFRKMQKAAGEGVPVMVIGPASGGREARELMLAGAAGYLPYSLSTSAVIGAIRVMAAGEIFVPSEMISAQFDPALVPTFTKREREVLAGLLAGKSNREIAKNLSLSEVTVKHHLKGLRIKLGARNRTHAVCRAIALGLD